uniref:Reverse transcriptase zinc-binding domain-containing protein n=1 Tax=Bracon brevicornis TaxID=1563983 RepID=A0A6V7M174_9HYME
MKQTSTQILEKELLKGQHYFKNYYERCKKPWYQDLSIGRPEITSLSRMRSNHNKLQSLQNQDIPHPLCSCGLSGTLPHIFWTCPKYINQRQVMILALRAQKIHSFSVISLLKFPSTKISEILHNFLKASEIEL